MKANATLEFIEASVADLESVRNLAHAIWPAVYRDLLAPEQISYMLSWMYSPTRLREDFDRGVIFLLMRPIAGEEDIGFCAFGPLQHARPCFIHKVYVAPEHHRKGVGGSALGEIEGRARSAGSSGLSLRVNRQNGPAIALYRKFGMEIIGADCAEIGGGFVMDDYLFEKRF